ncbi:DUF7507 domain-containing protein [Nonomuraea aridisoli]|uniref:DUF7507 domain-containing protein n=1 Tax=Nonomuraea aridisoli TaxID=2070368 RepID=A0A2W2FAV1_9ACTN|nr:hypothetical protein [Nonomuraea aridisoli]PZG21998.1 hypothetical protein C1J01_05185 [Nonomuraea aridisoli]
MMAATLLPAQPAAAQPVPLVEETFTGATSVPEFVAVGSACLTGAPPATPGTGSHPLTGCPEGAAGPVPPTGGAPFGYLQLTSADNNQTAAVLYDEPIASEQGLDVTFEQWQYGNTSDVPADGISFFLIDGTATPEEPGAFGGSLGYAQKRPNDDPANPFENGIDQGYVGVGLDVLGNYFGDWEQRGMGCAERSPAGTVFRSPAPGPNMVTVRGPGNGTQGYCFLTATTSNLTTTGPWPSTLPGNLHGPTRVVDDDPQQAQDDLEESRRTVNVRITPAPDPVLTVSIDFNDGDGMQQVLSTPAPTPVPSTYKFGFAASTGLFTDVHLIRNVVVRPVLEQPALTLTKRVAGGLPSDPVPVGTTVRYEYEVANTGNMDITDLVVNDDVVGVADCGTEPVTLNVGERITCTGAYVVTEEDAARGSVTNVATATGMADATVVNSPESQVTIEVAEQEEGELDLVKSVADARPYRPGNRVVYRYVVTNNSTGTVNDVRIEDSHVTRIRCRATTLAPGASTTCRGIFVVPAGTADECERSGCRFSITNTAVARAGDLTSATATATIRVVQKPHHCRPGKKPHHGTKPKCGHAGRSESRTPIADATGLPAAERATTTARPRPTP